MEDNDKGYFEVKEWKSVSQSAGSNNKPNFMCMSLN